MAILKHIIENQKVYEFRLAKDKEIINRNDHDIQISYEKLFKNNWNPLDL